MAKRKSWRQRLFPMAAWNRRDVDPEESRSLTEAPSSGGGSAAQRDPKEFTVKRIGLALGVGQGREYQPPDFDLTAITQAYDAEAYVRQAVDKYIEMMFKAGWSITGKNQNAVDYIRQRLALMAEMTQVPTDQLLIEIAEDLVKYSNVIVVKARDKKGVLSGSSLGVQVQGLWDQPPVAGYFPINVTTVSVLRDKTGMVRGWEQEVEGGDRPVRFKAADVVHIYYKKEKGRAFGTPFLLSVLDDIRALRRMEETVLNLTYRNLNPLIHIKVGTEDTPGQKDEIEAVQNEYRDMDLESGLVTSERVQMEAVDTDKVIDAKEYLRYFEQRVFTGLGISELMMGRGDTANRSTGDNLSGEFTDRVKAFQKIMAIFIDEHIIKELLMEGGFDPVLNPDDDVDFTFNEIDIDAQIKKENHAIYKYEHNAITESEMREEIGKDPITDRAEMHMNLVTIPLAASKSADSGGEAGTADTNNKNKPTNQHGTKDSPKSKESEEDHFGPVLTIYERSHEEASKVLDRYLKEDDHNALSRLSEVFRNTEGELVQLLGEELGEEAAKAYSVHLNRFVAQLHDDIQEATTEYVGADRSARIYETIGGLYEVQRDRLKEIWSSARSK